LEKATVGGSKSKKKSTKVGGTAPKGSKNATTRDKKKMLGGKDQKGEKKQVGNRKSTKQHGGEKKNKNPHGGRGNRKGETHNRGVTRGCKKKKKLKGGKNRKGLRTTRCVGAPEKKDPGTLTGVDKKTGKWKTRGKINTDPNLKKKGGEKATERSQTRPTQGKNQNNTGGQESPKTP